MRKTLNIAEPGRHPAHVYAKDGQLVFESLHACKTTAKLDGGGFGWKGRAQSPGLVDQLSDYLTSAPVHGRNPRLARVQRGLLV